MSEVCRYAGVVRTVYAEKQHFRGIENYFTDVILQKDEQEGGTDDGNEADAELDDILEKNYVELNCLVIELSDVTINLDTDNEGEQVFNVNPAFEYVLSSSTNISNNEDVLIKNST